MSRLATLTLTLALATLLGACRSQPQQPDPDDHFGDAVRNMVRQQIYDPNAAAHPAQDPPLSSDGQRAESAMANYRRAPALARRPISESADIGVSGQH